MNLSQQTKPYPRTMYHVNHEKPKVVNSKAEEAEASTKGWIVSYIYKEYPKWVVGNAVGLSQAWMHKNRWPVFRDLSES